MRRPVAEIGSHSVKKVTFARWMSPETSRFLLKREGGGKYPSGRRGSLSFWYHTLSLNRPEPWARRVIGPENHKSLRTLSSPGRPLHVGLGPPQTASHLQRHCSSASDRQLEVIRISTYATNSRRDKDAVNVMLSTNAHAATQPASNSRMHASASND